MRVDLAMMAACTLLTGVALGVGCSSDPRATENLGQKASAACDGEDEYQESDGSWVVCVYIEDDEPIEPPFTNPPEDEDPPPEEPPPDPSGGGGEPPPEEETACSVTLHACNPWHCVDNGQCTEIQKETRCDTLSQQNCGPIDHCNHCKAQFKACDDKCPNPPGIGGDWCGVICAYSFYACSFNLPGTCSAN